MITRSRSVEDDATLLDIEALERFGGEEETNAIPELCREKSMGGFSEALLNWYGSAKVGNEMEGDAALLRPPRGESFSSDENLDEILELGLVDSEDLSDALSFELDSVVDDERENPLPESAFAAEERPIRKSPPLKKRKKTPSTGIRTRKRAVKRETTRERKLRRNRELAKESRARKKKRIQNMEAQNDELKTEVTSLKQKFNLAKKVLKDANLYDKYKSLESTMLYTSVGLLMTFASISLNCMSSNQDAANIGGITC